MNLTKDEIGVFLDLDTQDKGFWGRACARLLLKNTELKETITWMLEDMDYRNKNTGIDKADSSEVAKAREQVKE